MARQSLALPALGSSRTQVLTQLRQMRDQDARWKEGRTFSLVFYADQDVLNVARDAYTLFFSENALNPGAFPSLKQLESEVIAMTADLLGGDERVVGNMTSGGTESILMACKTARDKFRAESLARSNHTPGGSAAAGVETGAEIPTPEIVVPSSAHPAFDKAAHYLGMKIIHVPVGEDYRADVNAMAAAISSNTVMLVASAPQYPQGVVDPVAELAAIARNGDLLLHVDACVGGFMLPFVKKAGYDIPAFDFNVSGVTSISVDLHKYGYAAKGASIILYRNRELRRHQYFVHTDWSGGIYGSPTMAGTRPAGAIAAAWAVMNYLGHEGYTRIAAEVMELAQRFRTGINSIPGLAVPGEPDMSVLCITVDRTQNPELDIFAVGDEMSLRGWHLDRQQNPDSLHLTVNRAHLRSVEYFLSDLAEAVQAAQNFSSRLQTQLGGLLGGLVNMLPAGWASRLTSFFSKLGGGGLPKRSAAMYGMMGSLPDRGELKEIVKDLMESFTALKR